MDRCQFEKLVQPVLPHDVSRSRSRRFSVRSSAMRRNPQLLITGLVSLLLVLYATIVYQAISTDYRVTLTSAGRHVAALCGAMEQHASRTMGEADSILDVTTHYLLHHGNHENGFHTEEFLGRANAILHQSPQIKAVFLVDPNGTMVANSEHTPFKQIKVNDREYYRYHREHEDSASHISAPVTSRLDGSRLFTITRRVNRPDGSLQMIAGLAIDPGYFSRFYRGLHLGGARGEVDLARSDGTILVSYPVLDRDGPRFLMDSARYRDFLKSSPQEGEAGTGDSAQLSALRISEHHPLVSFVSLNRDEILAPWRTRALRHGIGAAASMLLILLLTLTLIRRLKRLAGANETLRAQKLELELAAQVFEQSQQSIVITDRDGVILRVNSYFSELTGFTPEEAIGQTPRVLKSQRHDSDFYQELWRDLHQEGKWRGEIWNRKKNGDGFAALLSISSVRDPAGEIIYFIGVLEDITEQKISSERIYHLAHFDVLTNLPNRRLFNDRLDLAIQQSERYGTHFAVLFLDLDNFKRINDTLGHHAGDLLLQAVAQRLLDNLRKIDAVARFGGDEFAVMLEEVKEPLDVERIARKIIEAVSAPVDLEGVEVQVGVSIGVSIYPTDGTNVTELFKNSDSAMYRAKALGKNRCQFFDAEMAAQATRRLSMEAELRRAIPGELFLLYQPQAQLSGGAIGRAEALLRWQHPERGVILPEEFLHVAEESGQLGRLGNWVLETACRQAAHWQHTGGVALRVSVNVSEFQLSEPSFPVWVAALLRECHLDPECLELELTEAAVMGRVQESMRALGRLKEMGVHLALDNFGTGFASLLSLKKLPLDRLKIDRSFIADLEHSRESLGIVRMIIAMAGSLNLQVVAVGVEREAQRELLSREGCDEYQGHLLALPLPPAELEDFLARSHQPERR
jgi:diguanylate cyclase (GGDEF)-like protein/PAS domain S-box-containing protein